MVKKKDKGTTVSNATRTIIADGVHIENELFMDDDGNIAGKVSELLVNQDDVFKVTIKIELPDDEITED